MKKTAKNKNDYEKDISFLNNYFVFKKTNNVPADNVFNVHTKVILNQRQVK